jgi:uncharacterized membrane protein YqhA
MGLFIFLYFLCGIAFYLYINNLLNTAGGYESFLKELKKVNPELFELITSYNFNKMEWHVMVFMVLVLFWPFILIKLLNE